MSRFLFLSLPLAGHVHPIAAVANALADAGHDVAWAGSESFLRPSVGATTRVYQIPLRPHRGQGDLGMTAARSRWLDYVIPHARYTLPALERAIAAYQPDVLAVDQHAVAGAVAAYRHGMRWASLAPTSMELTRPYGTTLPLVEDWILARLHELWTGAGLPGSPPYDLRFSPHLVLAFTTDALVDVERLPPHASLVGPALGARPEVDFPWHDLDPRRRLVLGTVGTLAVDLATGFFRRLVEGLQPLRDRIQLVVVASAVPALPPHVLVRHRVPMLRLLPHVDAVVSHGGLNTVCESLAHGVPLVVAPIKDDQPINAGRVVAAGAGVRVSFARATPVQLRDAVLAVLDDPRYRAEANRVRQSLRAAGGARTAAARLAALAARPSRTPPSRGSPARTPPPSRNGSGDTR